MSFAGLYQMTHEMIKKSVIDDVKAFYGYVKLDEVGVWSNGDAGKEAYRRNVLDLAPKKVFDASLLWLRAADAVTSEQMARLNDIYNYRHVLTHELVKFIIDVDFEPDIELLTDAIQILRALSRFWIQIEKDIGTFDTHGDVDIDSVESGPLLVLDMCIRAHIDGLDEISDSDV
ncbi:hypothetical protein C5C56_15470 [Rathayibacter sp. AY1D1]|nr:hypothetical protein C5C56_15470 [Rathayibacter sp. AY1D1]